MPATTAHRDRTLKARTSLRIGSSWGASLHSFLPITCVPPVALPEPDFPDRQRRRVVHDLDIEVGADVGRLAGVERARRPHGGRNPKSHPPESNRRPTDYERTQEVAGRFRRVLVSWRIAGLRVTADPRAGIASYGHGDCMETDRCVGQDSDLLIPHSVRVCGEADGERGL
jgi:hypothetical protein